MSYDVVVAGAGPAGAASAAILASGGAKVLVLDRAHFPRDKACGGGLTPRGVAALSRLGVDTGASWFARVGGLELSAGGRTCATAFPSTTKWPSSGVVATRADLDAAVLERSVAAGAEVRHGVRVSGPLMEDGVCRGLAVVDGGSRSEIRATHTIAADGATSVVARGAGLARPAASGAGFWYAALRGYFTGVTPRRVGSGEALEFYPLRSKSGRWLPAYGWVFPLPGGVANVGVDLPHRPVHAPTPSLRAAYDEFVRTLRIRRPGFERAETSGEPIGALLPEGMAGVRPAAPGLLSVGDAAGLVTPYSGEGILYALESAEIAADVILSGVSARAACDAYARRLRDTYGFHFRLALRFMKSVRRGPLARAAASVGLRSPRVLRAAVRVMANLIDEDADSTVSTLYGSARRLLDGGRQRGG